MHPHLAPTLAPDTQLRPHPTSSPTQIQVLTRTPPPWWPPFSVGTCCIRRQGIRAIPAHERSEILTEIGLHRPASLDLAEQEIAEHRMAVQAVHVPQGEELLVPEIPPFSDHESVGIVDLWS